MRCPTCGYEFDPAGGLACPRCGSALDCTAVDCGSCGACAGPFARLARQLTSMARREDEGAD
ncbi:MAG: hypothetical protein ABEJ92_02745 [Halobacteriales archaeon]